MPTPAEILDLAMQRATANLQTSLVRDALLAAEIDYVARNLKNRAGARLLLACSLAKAHPPKIDIRKPYTEIGTPDAYSGRVYDEVFVAPFAIQHQLPLNPTTAFLTPALRNRNVILTRDLNLVGTPPRLYEAVLRLLDAVYEGAIGAEELLAETLRCLVVYAAERSGRMETLLAELRSVEGALPLSAEAIVSLLEQHLKCKGASRLPVLMVTAAYQAAQERLGERVLPLRSHNAADEQTRSLGDVEVALIDDPQIMTCYEMKLKRVTRLDIDLALQKISDRGHVIDNYVFITTDIIELDVRQYAADTYFKAGGIEVVVLDCIGFVRHFLHLFHRLRMQYLQAYQELLLAEPESAVGQPLKEVFLALRQAAESGEVEGGEVESEA